MSGHFRERVPRNNFAPGYIGDNVKRLMLISFIKPLQWSHLHLYAANVPCPRSAQLDLAEKNPNHL